MNNKALTLTLTAVAIGNIACDGGIAENGYVKYEQSVVVEQEDVVVTMYIGDKLPADLVDRLMNQIVVKPRFERASDNGLPNVVAPRRVEVTKPSFEAIEVVFPEVEDSDRIIWDPIVRLKTGPGYVVTIPSELEKDLKEFAEEYKTEAQLHMAARFPPTTPPQAPEGPRPLR